MRPTTGRRSAIVSAVAALVLALAGAEIAFGPLAATSKACLPAVMDQESKFFSALGKARSWRIDPIEGKLTLLDGDGRPLVVLARM